MGTAVLQQLQRALADRYSVERPLGQGGMAVVYLAYDLKHHRKVALKVMRPEIAENIGSARFVREIEVAARLQHPNILTMLDSGEVENLFFYVMPYVEGESLRDRIAQTGALPIPEAVRILTEVADALSHAHAHGVVHRDIKPENVLLSGRHALVADFGVAKASSPTTTGRQRLTRTGLAIGTPAYMAPEQAMADANVDHRVDIYSLGVMGFEMLAGKAPFAAGSLQEMLAAQVSEVPETVEKYRPEVSPALAHVVMKCLAKNPADRWQTADEIVARLEPLGSPSGEVSSAATVPLTAYRQRRRLWAAVVPGIFGVVGIAAVLLVATGRIKRTPFAVAVSDIAQVSANVGVEFQPALSPDGKQVAYVAGAIGAPHLVIRSAVNAGAGGQLVMQDSALGSAWRPNWTADGEFVRYQACPRGGPIRLGAGGAFGFGSCRPEEISRLGGASRPVAMAAGEEWAASADGSRIAWVRADTIVTALASGTEVRAVPIRSETGRSPLHSLSWSPDGRRIAYVSGNLSWLTSANVDVATVWVVDLDKGTTHRITDNDHLSVSPAWFDARHLLFVSDRDGPRGVYVVEVGSDGPRGAPRAIPGLSDPHTISYAPAAGRLAFSRFTTRQNIWSYPLGAPRPVSIRDGTPVTDGNHLIEEHDVSPDGKSIVFAGSFSGSLDLFRMTLPHGDVVALTTTPGSEDGPAWSPDGREIVYYTMDSGNTRQLWVMPAEGGAAIRLTEGPAMKHLPRWRPDGLAVSFSVSAGQETHAWLVARDSVGGPWHEPVQLADFRANAMDWATDGRSFVSSAVAGDFVDVTGDRKTSLRAWPAARALQLDRGAPLRYSRDGRTVYGVGNHADGRRGIWAIPAQGDAPPRLVVAFDDPAIVPLMGTGNLMSVGPDRLYLSLAQYESDIWVATLRR